MTFAAPLFLLGLVGLLVPWALHRLNQQNAPVKDFPSERFLESAKSISARQKRLRYLGLLALRGLLLLVLCLLFAQPLFKKLGEVLGDPDQLHVLVLDQSFSMRMGDRWERALEKIKEASNAIPANMPVQLLTASETLSTVTEATLDRAQIAAAVASLAPGYGQLEFGSMIRRLGSFAEKSDLPVVVHLITDAQASAMPIRLSDLIDQRLTDVNIYEVAAGALENQAVTGTIKPESTQQFSVVASVSNFGGSDSASIQTLSLLRGNEVVSERDVTLPSGGTTTEEFNGLSYPSDGRLVDYSIQLAPEDSLKEDNVALLPVRAETPVSILITSDSRATLAENSNEVLYTKTALRLDRRNEAVVVPLSATSLKEKADTVIYLHSEPLSSLSIPPLPAELDSYLKEGGRVLYVLNSSSADKVIDPTPGITAVASVDENHPLNLDIEEWSYLSFYTHQALSVPENTEVLITATNGQPILMESSLGNGRLLILNAALNGTDNDLPLSALFVPFIESVMDYFLRFDAYPSRLTVGDSVKLPKSVQILNPAGNPLLELAQTNDGSSHVVTEPGVYTLLDQRGEHSVVVTTNIAESDTSVASGEQLENWQSQQSAVTVKPLEKIASAADAAPLNTPEANTPEGMSLTRWLLPLGVLLLLAEVMVANRYLRVRRTA